MSAGREAASQLSPACRVLPATTSDVITTINTVRETGATFAVKSGGHCSYASGSNAEDGITIDLSRLKDITVSEDRKSVFVGAGCRFREVYSKLEAYGLGCVGGRVSSVGVSGLIMGGGISFFSAERGLACDNVVSYELVLVSGQVLNVTRESHPDLFWGMRGAGITLGIVTRLELKTFDLGEIWGGASVFAHEHGAAILTSFDKSVKTTMDPFAEAFLLISDRAKDGNSVYTMAMSHSRPAVQTKAFDDFKTITPLASSTQNRTLLSFCDEGDVHNEPGFRFWTTSQSVKSHLTTLKEIAAVHEESVALLKDCDGFSPTLLYQPLVSDMLPKDDIGNALGITTEDTPLIIVALLWKWIDAKHDKPISQTADDFMNKVERVARAHGTFHRYQYLNYAARHQDVYGGYGEENRKRLRELQAKYDPEDLMSKLRPGIIQLSGPRRT
ncbi:FAD-binding domain-containing protein [Trichoderma citrinoviride]|uniref:FAD-binding domain-containing protein n=1 Tax=Trichoderma citrinoviride TaxID=58853 RepID=A0A2T4B780_9HYPO|nr:FAD-binding domain-containing protein [Trichoderma citrinoviride]PTB65194.1 FAD-binding domain-containing protein [Trichoderma citrinoviride]